MWSIAPRSSSRFVVASACRPGVMARLGATRFLSDEDGPKAKQRKVKKKDKKIKGSEGDSHRIAELVLKALNAPSTYPPEPSDEERARREQVLKNYTIGRFREHNEMNHELACKIKMKRHARKMLPKRCKMRDAAVEITTDGPPLWRHIPVWTPPIPGFDPNDFIRGDDD